MLKVFIAKFDVQPWDLTHQVGYLSLSSPSVCAIFYNSENMNVLGIRIVNPRFYFIPRVIMCTYVLIISFMVLAALESRAFCCCIRSLWAERQIVESTMICMYPKESLVFGKMQQQATHLVVGFFCSELGVFILILNGVCLWCCQVEVTEWRARIWGEALKSQGVEDMELARVWPRHPLPFSFVCKHTACSAAEWRRVLDDDASWSS